MADELLPFGDVFAAVMGQYVPPEDAAAIAPDALDGPQLAAAAALAKNPSLGEPFALGGLTFRRCFPTIAAEEELDRLLAAGQASAVAAVMVVLRDQRPELTEVDLVAAGVTAADLDQVLDGQRALGKLARDMRDTFEARRARWRATSAHADLPAIPIPPETAATAMLEWGARTYGDHPDDVRRRYSSALLICLWDAWWWGSQAPPPARAADGPRDAVTLTA